jgi:hypothetical protein
VKVVFSTIVGPRAQIFLDLFRRAAAYVDKISRHGFVAMHESADGTELPIRNVRSSVDIGGKAENICSM